MDEGESIAEAAARELYEEAGLRIAPEELRGPVARSRGAWTHHGISYWTEDAVFFARIAEWRVTPDSLAPPERELAARHRWWPVADLLHTEATISPRGLGSLVARLLAGGLPHRHPRSLPILVNRT